MKLISGFGNTYIGFGGHAKVFFNGGEIGGRMNTERLVITDNLTEKLELEIDDGGERFGLIHTDKDMCLEGKSVIILNPREAQDIARFINRNGGKVK